MRPREALAAGTGLLARCKRVFGRIGGAGPMVGSHVSLTVMQGLQFFLLARALGAYEFGTLAAVMAITSALLPFVGLGTGSVALMRLARGEGQASLHLGNALALIGVTGIAGLVIACTVAVTILPARVFALALLLGVADLVLARAIDAAAQVFLGLERYSAAIAAWNLHAGLRLACAAGFFAFAPSPTALGWASLHFLCALAAAAAVVAGTCRVMGRPRFDWRLAWSAARVGFFFASVAAARNVCADGDKAILARTTSMTLTGAYNAAFRLMYMSFTPVVAMLAAFQARFFRAGAQGGLHGVRASMLRPALFASGFGLFAGTALYLVAPLLPILLGSQFAASTDMLQAMAGLPLLLACQFVCSESLLAANRVRTVGLAHAAAACASVGINILVAPVYAWQGCLGTAYAVQGALIVFLASSIRLGSRKPPANVLDDSRTPQGAA